MKHAHRPPIARALAGVARADRFPAVDVNLQQQAAKVPGDLNTSGQAVISRRYDANLGVAAQIVGWLWITVLFANFYGIDELVEQISQPHSGNTPAWVSASSGSMANPATLR